MGAKSQKSSLSLIERLKQFASQSANMLNLDVEMAVSMSQPIKSAVMIIGGGEDKVQDRKILRAFVENSGGASARIAIIPSASREPDIIGRIYHQIFTELRAEFVEVFDIRERLEQTPQEVEAQLDGITGIFMTGGDQLRLCALIAETPLAIAIRERTQKGKLVLAGTSAGAAVMGYHMIAGGGSGDSPNKEMVSMSIGLGIIPSIIVDQHFHNRNRMARLMTAIAAHPDRLGVGIDEDTVAIFEQDNIMRVMGRGTVTIVDPAEVSYSNQLWVSDTAPLTIHNLRVHILSAGSKYNLAKRSPLSPTI
ncbi:cyanophycinase [Synechococcus sp. PCC 7502]|nr:cyanophycinase [Synechococcus sp. PCC 7502]AFY74476.1 cyanophycinase [Synechococcus sp. PCC 7502]